MADLSGLKGKVAIVWGGGAGMGAATVRQLADLGCAIGVVDIDAAAAEGIARAISAAGGKAVATTADVRDEGQVQAAVDAVSRALGCPNLSASVVGIALQKPFLETTGEDWDFDQARNLRPAFLIGRAVAAAMRDAGQPGAIVYVASISGFQSAGDFASYSAAKAGLMSLVRTMGTHLAPYGIRVNAVAPGVIRTVRIGTPEAERAASVKVPMGRTGTVEEMASVMAFLLSDMASYVTGQTLVADGGWLASK